jgi:hypothetical protein
METLNFPFLFRLKGFIFSAYGGNCPLPGGICFLLLEMICILVGGLGVTETLDARKTNLVVPDGDGLR